MANAETAPLRIPLSRQRILREALRLVDKEGLEAMSMRRLGRLVGVEAMSLYNHVVNKGDIVDGILDIVLDEFEPASSGGDWETAVWRSATSAHEALKRHPWSVGLIMTAVSVRPARLAYMEGLLARLRDAGFSADTTYHAYHLLDSHVFGSTLWATSYAAGMEKLPEFASKLSGVNDTPREFLTRFLGDLSIDDYPYLLEHAEQHLSGFGRGEPGAFELGLDLILEGLRRNAPATIGESPSPR